MKQLMTAKIQPLFILVTLLGMGILFAQSYQVDTEASSLRWTGKKVIGQHNGTVNIKNGILNISNNGIEGQFAIDMHSILNTDIKIKKFNQKLVDHLKSEDFFWVDKYPIATLVLKKVKSLKKSAGNKFTHKIEAVLTIKGMSHTIHFPAEIKFLDNSLEALAEFKIDRTKWNIKYGSGSFFSNLGDKTIDDMITFELILNAKLLTLENKS